MYISTPHICRVASCTKIQEYPILSTRSMTALNCNNVFIHLSFSTGGDGLSFGDEEGSAEDFFVGFFLCNGLLEVPLIDLRSLLLSWSLFSETDCWSISLTAVERELALQLWYFQAQSLKPVHKDKVVGKIRDVEVECNIMSAHFIACSSIAAALRSIGPTRLPISHGAYLETTFSPPSLANLVF